MTPDPWHGADGDRCQHQWRPGGRGQHSRTPNSMQWGEGGAPSRPVPPSSIGVSPPSSSLESCWGTGIVPLRLPTWLDLPIRISPETSPCPFPFPQPPPRCSLVCGKRRVHPGTPLPWGDLAPSEGQTSVTAASPGSNPGPDKSLNPGACLPICYSGIARVPHLPGLLKGKSIQSSA